MRQSSPERQLLFCHVADSHFRRKWLGLELGHVCFFQAEIQLVRCLVFHLLLGIYKPSTEHVLSNIEVLILYSTLLPYPTLLYPTLVYSTLPYSTLPYPTIVYYSTLPYPSLPYPTLLYSTLLYSTLLLYTLLYSTLLYSTLLYSTLLYSRRGGSI